MVTPANGVATGNVLTNDLDVDGDLLVATPIATGGPANGSVTLNPDGTFAYTPDPGFTGEDQFSYSVCDNGTPVLCDTAIVYIEVIADPASGNLPPVANPDAHQTEQNVPINGHLLSNDSDPNGDALVITTTPLLLPDHGSLVINPDGSYTYTPDSSFTGQDTFHYEVCDDRIPALCDTAIAVIAVLPDHGNTTFAHDDAGITSEDIPLSGNVTANDFDPEGDPVMVSTTPVVAPVHGTLSLNPDGSYLYIPDPGFSGHDFFQYSLCDDGSPVQCDTASVSIAVLPVNDPPMAIDDINVMPENTFATGNVLINDVDPENDALTVSTTPVSSPSSGTVVLNADGTYTYMPAPGFSGEDQFTYEVCDDGTPVLCDTATVYLEVVPNVIPFNLPPVANPDANQTEEGIPVSGNLLSNDFDPNGDMLVIDTVPVINPANGTVDINPDGTYTYSPNPGFSGFDVFSYEVCDDQTPALCDITLVMIDVIPDTSNATCAHDDAFATEVNTSLNGNVLLNDFDPEGDNQTVSPGPVSAPQHGVVTLMADGSFTYVPQHGFTGQDFFTYAVCDDGSPQACDTASVYIAVLACPGVSLRMFLQGSLLCTTESLMRDDLRASGLIPLLEPYSTPPYSSRFAHVGLGGGELIADSLGVFGQTGPNAIVDWVFIELRDRNDSTVVVETRSALVQRDGDVVDTDGESPVYWCSLPDTVFFVAVHHRNHLGVMTAVPRSVTPDLPLVDFNTDSLYRQDGSIFSQPTVTVNGINALWAGNTVLDDHILFSGIDNESDGVRNFVLSDPINVLLGGLLNYAVGGYTVYDVNMNGASLFSGLKNDNDVIRDNVLLHPANVLLGGLLNFAIPEQLPD
ncbi:MAG: Ig-like domain-containing protein [Saprospiraceae bacterium]|nr:Ig-like domain-containing protein [Saprospiraceae bacterium]